MILQNAWYAYRDKGGESHIHPIYPSTIVPEWIKRLPSYNKGGEVVNVDIEPHGYVEQWKGKGWLISFEYGQHHHYLYLPTEDVYKTVLSFMEESIINGDELYDFLVMAECTYTHDCIGYADKMEEFYPNWADY